MTQNFEESQMLQALKKAHQEVPELILLDSYESDMCPGSLYTTYRFWTEKTITNFFLYKFECPVKKNGFLYYQTQNESSECLKFVNIKQLEQYTKEHLAYGAILQVANNAIITKNYYELDKKLSQKHNVKTTSNKI